MGNRIVNRLAVAAAGLAVAGCGSSDPPEDINAVPEAVVATSVQRTTYDGTTNDLLTGGLGASGLASATAPTFADPVNPTAAELRRRAIHTNYRALFDMTAAGGYGTFYGPGVALDGGASLGEGLIAGDEWIAYADDGTGRRNVTIMVQVPASFDRANPCIVTAPSSGSRGVYGAIGVAGEWGLKRRCAVAYTDKGTGNAFHDLQNDTVGLIDGRRTTATAAGSASAFTADLTAQQRADFNAVLPNRFAAKHAHSQRNPEMDWGRDMLDAVRFAFYAINQTYGEQARDGQRRLQTFVPANTLVIASGVSNGGGASIAAAELDAEGLIDGVAVGMPMVQPRNPQGLTVRRGTTTVQAAGLPLLDYTTYASLYQPCASLAASNAQSPGLAFVNAGFAANRCAELKDKGLLSGATPAEWAADAQARLNAYGWETDSDLLHASHFAFATHPIAVTYANTYGRFSVADQLCGYSFAAIDGTTFQPTALPAAVAGRFFSDGNGIPPTPTGGINVIYDLSLGGPIVETRATSPSSGLLDYGLDGALCLRALATGSDPLTGQALAGAELARAQRVATGISEVQRSGNLRGKPTIIVHGRADALVPVNHSSRPYVALNRAAEGDGSRLRYVEVEEGQHFDSFIGALGALGYATRFVPIQPYLIQALDLVWANLRTGAALPPSQVVRTTPRAAAADPLTAANVPPIQATPGAGDRIEASAGTVVVPD